MKTEINGLKIFDKDGGRIVSVSFIKQKFLFLLLPTSALVFLSILFFYRSGPKVLPAVPFVLFVWLTIFVLAVRCYIKITKKADGSLSVANSNRSVAVQQNSHAKIVYSKSKDLIFNYETKIHYKDGSGQEQEFLLDNLRGGRGVRFILSKTQAEEMARQLGIPFEARD